MGHAKKQRRWARQLWRDVIAVQRKRYTRNPKPPCSTCAFRDPEAWVADQAMRNKVVDCLGARGPLFYCHEGMPCGDGAYEPPRTAAGSIDEDQLTPCGGFVRFAQHWWDLAPQVQAEEVDRLQLHMLRRYLETHPGFAASIKDEPIEKRARWFQMAVQAMARGNGEIADER